MRKGIFLIMAAFALAGNARQVMPENCERLYSEMVTLFQNADYRAAGSVMAQWDESQGVRYASPAQVCRTDFMRAVIEHEQSPYGAKETLAGFMERYPNSVYANRALALMGNSCYLRSEYAEAIICYDECDFDALSASDRDKAVRYNAISLIKTGQTEEGRVMLNVLELIGEDVPGDQLAFYKAVIDYSNGNIQKAGQGFLDVEPASGLYDRSQAYLAEIKLRNGDWKGAEQIAREILATPQVAPEARLEAERILGQALYGQGEYAQASDMLLSYVSASESADRLEYLQLGMISFYGKDYVSGIRYLNNAAIGDDEIAQNAWLHIGLANLAMDRKDNARMAFEQAAKNNANDKITEQAMFNYAMSVEETSYSWFSDSENAFDVFLNRYPDSEYADKARSHLANAYLHSNNYSAALASIEKIRNPGTSILAAKQQLLYRQGTVLYASDDITGAYEYFTRAAGMSVYDAGLSAMSYFWRAECQYRMGRYDAAWADYNRYMELTPKNRDNIYALAIYGSGYALYQQGEYDRALTTWNELLRNRTDYSEAGSIIADTYSRVGDCLFLKRDYEKAYSSYIEAYNTNRTAADYALYRAGISKGLKKDYETKIECMEKVIRQFPASPYVSSALYEQARACQQTDRTDRAIETYRQIISGFPNSDLARTAATEIALIYFQIDNYNAAIDAYKYVIEKYPNSEEAQTAIKDLSSVYVEMGKVSDYLAYVDQVKGEENIQGNERDSLTYTAAEMQFSKGNYEAAARDFADYVKTFPNGAHTPDAYFYMGQSLQQQGNPDAAIESYMHVADYKFSRFVQPALANASGLAFAQQDYESAMDLYIRYYEVASGADAITESLYGIVVSAYQIEESDAILQYAESALQSALSSEKKQEVKYYLAKAYLKDGQPDAAMPLLNELSSEKRTPRGAESNFLIGEIMYDKGQYGKAETQIMAFIKSGTTQNYWLARSLILLSDLYMAQGKQIEARQYLLSLQQNYTVQDEVQQMITDRLSKLQ